MAIALLSPGLAGSFGIPALTSQMQLRLGGGVCLPGSLAGRLVELGLRHVIILPYHPAPHLESRDC